MAGGDSTRRVLAFARDMESRFGVRFEAEVQLRPATPGGELPELVATLAARVTALSALPVDDGSRYSVRRLTVGWLLEAASVHTRAAHLRDLDAYLGWCARERLDPVTARPTDLAQFRVWRELQGTGGRAAAASTVARALASVSSWYTHLVANSDDRVSRNPAAAAKRPRVNAHTSTTAGLTLTEVDLLLAQADAEADERTARFSWYARWLMFAPVRQAPNIRAPSQASSR